MKRLLMLMIMLTMCTPTIAFADETGHKTAADVADKALDMFSNSVANLSAAVQKVAPEIWRVMIRQQYAEAIAEVMSGLLGLLIVIVITLFIRKLVKQTITYAETDYNTDVAWVVKEVLRVYLPLLFIIIFSGVLVNNITDATQRLINPEYYAIKDIASLVAPKK